MAQGAPIDPETPVGQLRLLVGDADGAQLVPPQMDLLDYANFSDDQLAVAISLAGGDIVRAAGFAYSQLAAFYVAQGKSVKTDDLNIDIRQRGNDMIEVAQSFFAQADALAGIASGSSVDIIGFQGREYRTL